MYAFVRLLYLGNIIDSKFGGLATEECSSLSLAAGKGDDIVCNPHGQRYEVVTIEPPVGGQLDTTVAQDGSWRDADAYLIDRQKAYGHAIAELLGHGSSLGRTLRDDADIDEAVRGVSAGTKLFFLPHTTMCDPRTARRLGLTDDSFYGGCVSHTHESTKLIMHGLWQKESVCPEGWNHALAQAIEPHTLPGYSTFDLDDLCAAASHILKHHGGARIKLGTGSGGEGQYLLTSTADLDSAMAQIASGNYLVYGASVEVDLFDAVAWSICEETFCNLSLATIGKMLRPVGADRSNPEPMIEAITVRGTLDDINLSLVDTCISREELRAMVDHVRAVNKAIELHLPHLLVNRRAYNAVVGRDAHGKRHVGVIEQSWRRGQMTANALIAARAFAQDGMLSHVATLQNSKYVGALSDDMWELSHRNGVRDVVYITKLF